MVSFSSSLKSDRLPRPGRLAETARAFAQAAAALHFPIPVRRDRSPADLAKVIENEIIPRLMLAHRPAADTGVIPAHESAVGPRTLEAFARATLTGGLETLTAFVESLLHGGLTLEEVYLDLLIPTARRLGEDWDEDLISFTDVTIGLSRLQQVVRALGAIVPPRELGDDARSVLLVPCFNQQHTFGLVILEDCFRRAGWRTCLDMAATREDSADQLRGDWFDVFALSATTDTSSEMIAGAIAQMRRASCNPGLFVMVGGRLFAEQPELVAEVGADATAAGGREALLIAENAVRPQAYV